MPNIGSGIFAREASTSDEIIFAKGHMIAKYNGEFMDNDYYGDRYDDIYPHGPYAMYFNHTHTIDSACMRGVAALINHKKKRRGANAKFSIRKNGVFVVAIKDIRAGEEIYADYGPNYVFEKNFKTIGEENTVIY